MAPAAPSYVAPDPAGRGALLALKVVPGASRDGLAGVLGERLKVRVQAPPAAGRANAALLEVLAGALGVPPARLEIVRGHGRPQKTVLVLGLDAAAVARRIEETKA